MKEFFQNKYVMIAESVLLVLGSIGLTVSGVDADGVQKIGSLAISVITAIDALATAITAIVLDKSKKPEESESKSE